jgi:hypothetical protein
MSIIARAIALSAVHAKPKPQPPAPGTSSPGARRARKSPGFGFRRRG